MITLFIFYLHTITAVGLYTIRWQEASWKEGMLAVGFLALVFSVGWSITAFLLGLFVPQQGLGIWLDRDTMSLLLLTILEAIFFAKQLKNKQRKLQAA